MAGDLHRTAQPPTLAAFRPWGSSTGAGRVRPANAKIVNSRNLSKYLPATFGGDALIDRKVRVVQDKRASVRKQHTSVVCWKTYFQPGLSIRLLKWRKNDMPYLRSAEINAISLKRIGLISDTHGFLDDAVLRHFEQCDEIWHAGDFGDRSLSDRLSHFRPLTGVYGNIDGYDIRSIHPEFRCWSCEDLKVLMIHIGGYPGRYSQKARMLMQEHRPGLFITGHSHILKVMHDPKLGCLHMNPGAAGKQGWHKVRTLIRFTVDGSDIRDCEVVEMAR